MEMQSNDSVIEKDAREYAVAELISKHTEEFRALVAKHLMHLVETRMFARRPDGWPLCPNCGEDELYSALNWDGTTERPPMQEWIDAGLTCYKCGWSTMRLTNVCR